MDTIKHGRQAKVVRLHLASGCFLCFVCAAASIGCQKDFEKYMERSKTLEAKINVKKLYDGARVYYMYPAPRLWSREKAPPTFPEPAAGPTPPLGECCQQGGLCQPDPDRWASEPWKSLHFSLDEPHHYSYSYEVMNLPDFPRSSTFAVVANGDLDCDGVYSTFRIEGSVDLKGWVPGKVRLERENEHE